MFRTDFRFDFYAGQFHQRLDSGDHPRHRATQFINSRLRENQSIHKGLLSPDLLQNIIVCEVRGRLLDQRLSINNVNQCPQVVCQYLLSTFTDIDLLDLPAQPTVRASARIATICGIQYALRNILCL